MWNFACPLIVYGDSALDYLAQVKGKKAFIVTDKNIVKLGLAKLVTDQLDAVNIKWNIFDEVEPEPSLDTIKERRSSRRQIPARLGHRNRGWFLHGRGQGNYLPAGPA